MARTADKTDIPKRLAKAGYELFNQHGYNATGIQQITDAAGVPKGSFYAYFPSKEALAVAILEHYWSDITRCFFLGHIGNPKLEEIYNIAKEANLAAIAKVKPGVAAKEIVAA